LRKVANRQTNKQTNNNYDYIFLAEVISVLLCHFRLFAICSTWKQYSSINTARPTEATAKGCSHRSECIEISRAWRCAAVHERTYKLFAK